MNLKMKCLVVNFLLVLFSCNSIGQSKEKSTEPCDCNIAFEDLVEKLESNYIALAQMRLSKTESTYEDRKIDYREKSDTVDSENCTAFLNDFLSFFEDGHLSVNEYPNYSEAELAEFKQNIKENILSQNTLDSLTVNNLKSKGSDTDSILGVWTDGKSDFIVVEVDDVYNAYITASTIEGIESGELKATLSPSSNGFEVTYYSYGYNKRYIRGGVYKDGAVFRAGNVFWIRKGSSFDKEIKYIDKSNFESPTIAMLDDKNTLVSLPSFNLDFKSFNDFIEENKNLILNSENLIIDIRGNRGGNGIYFPLIELYATQNMKGDRQGLVLASLDNLAYFERQQQYSRKLFKPVTERIENNLNEIVDGPLYPEKKFKINKSKIKNVAILTDEACASAAESFIIHSKASSTKVKTFGTPTDGMIDYTSVNSLLLECGKQYIYFGYPTSTLHKDIPNNGFNKTGIIPDIPIQEDVEGKIDFIIKYYER